MSIDDKKSKTVVLKICLLDDNPIGKGFMTQSNYILTTIKGEIIQ